MLTAAKIAHVNFASVTYVQRVRVRSKYAIAIVCKLAN